MIETTDLTAKGEEFKALKKDWVLAHIGPDAKGDFSRWAKMRAYSELKDQLKAEIITRAEYQERLESLGDRMTAGAYNWGSELGNNDQGEGIQAMLKGGPGLCKLMQLLLEPRHGPVDGKTIMAMLLEGQQFAEAHGVESPVKAALSRALADPVPNAEAPATTTSQPGAETKTTNGKTSAA